MSAIEQHYHQLFSASWSPTGGERIVIRHPAHSPVCAGQSFITLPGCKCLRTPAISLSFIAQPNSQWLEKSGILYVHIYLPAAGLHQMAEFSQPSVFLTPRSQAGSIRGWAEMARRAGCKIGRPHQTPERRRAYSPPFMRHSLLEVSKELSGQHKKHFQASAAKCSPFPSEAGRRSH